MRTLIRATLGLMAVSAHKIVGSHFWASVSALGAARTAASAVAAHVTPEAANTHPEDGRAWNEIFFTRRMTLVNSSGRLQEFEVPYDLNAGICLDDEVQNPLLPWKYIAIPGESPDTFRGDVERSDGK